MEATLAVTMKRRPSIQLAAALATLLWAWASALPSPRIVSGPTVRTSGDGYAITFEVDGPCDVTVRVVDAQDEVVRHLVSGMVGLERAAAPLRPGSLEQTLAWDGKDDSRNDAPSGSKAVVSVGMRVTFDRFLLWEKDACPRSRANYYHVSENGHTYVNQSSGVHLDTLRLLDSEGRLIRQVWPPRLDRSREALESLLSGPWGASDWDGDGVPIKVCYNSWYVFGVRSGAIARTTDGYVVGVFTGVGQGFYVLDPNDFPRYMHWNPPWFEREQMYRTRWSVTAGSDGDVYITDSFHHLIGHFRAADMSPLRSFTHEGAKELDEPRYTLGAGRFQGPDAIALNPAGHICVLDGDAVAIYAKTGELVQEAGKDAFPGEEPTPSAVRAAEKSPRALCFPGFLKIDSRGRLIVQNEGVGMEILESDLNGNPVRTVPLPWGHSPGHGYSDFDAAGSLYLAVSARNQPQQIWKLAPDGTRAKFGDHDAIVLGAESDPFALSKGICVGPDGDLYVVLYKDKWTTKVPDMTGGVRFGDLSARGAEACQTRVDVYGRDGALKRKGIVRSVGINDVAVDRAGSIYVIDGTMWHGAQMGGVARGQSIYGKQHWPFQYLTPEQAALDPATQSNKRYSLLSRLVKFGPQGGILDDAGDAAQLWDHAGISGVSPWNCGAECPAAQICLDPDERLWIPDSFLYCVKAIDRAGNEMLRVGKYGNEDCQGGGGDARHPEMENVVIDPEIPLAYPKGIAVHGDWLLLSDMFSHRVLRCRIEYADSRTVSVE